MVYTVCIINIPKYVSFIYKVENAYTIVRARYYIHDRFLIHIIHKYYSKTLFCMTPPIDEEASLIDENRLNMLDFYRKELLDLIKGKIIVDSVPLGTRRRLVEYGVLRKFGTNYEVTSRGLNYLLS